MKTRTRISLLVVLAAFACSDRRGGDDEDSESDGSGDPGDVDAAADAGDSPVDPGPDAGDVPPDGEDVPVEPDDPSSDAADDEDPPCASSDPTCDGVDDDCDDEFDEDYVPGTCGTGACERDTACVDGVETCIPGPSTGDDSDCDGVDDDCDGPADEHYASHTCGTGPCERESTCVAGAEDCTPGLPSGGDTDCDGMDDDCDGPADEHYAPFTCGWGPCESESVCSAGHETCTPPYDDSVWPSTWASYEVDVVTEMNAERLAGAFCNGTWYPAVPILAMNADLREAARCHSLDMASNDFFSHTGSDGSSFSTRCTNAGYTASPRGENIAAGYSSPASAVAGWMASTSGHCEMIMNSSVNEVGVGYAYDPSSAWDRYWTADFGRR